MAAEALVTVEQQHAGFGEVFDETRALKQRIRDLEVRGHKRSQDVEDLLAGSVALSDDVDDLDGELKAERDRNWVANAEIIALWERDRQKDIALGVMAQMNQDLELRLQKLEQRFYLVGVEAVERVAAIMARV